MGLGNQCKNGIKKVKLDRKLLGGRLDDIVSRNPGNLARQPSTVIWWNVLNDGIADQDINLLVIYRNVLSIIDRRLDVARLLSDIVGLNC